MSVDTFQIAKSTMRASEKWGSNAYEKLKGEGLDSVDWEEALKKAFRQGSVFALGEVDEG